MAGQTHSAQEWTGQRSRVRDDAKRPRTPNFQAPTAVPGWSLLVKSEASECQNFLSQLAKAKVRHEPLPFGPAVATLATKMEFHSGLLRVPVLGFVAAGTPRRSWC